MKVPPPHPVPPRPGPGPPPGRCPAATTRDRGREGRHPPQGPQGQSIPANGARRAARDPGWGTRNGAQGPSQAGQGKGAWHLPPRVFNCCRRSPVRWGESGRWAMCHPNLRFSNVF